VETYTRPLEALHASVVKCPKALSVE
jgi:hypothetical protein